jgi:hypothetical protein
MMHVQIEQNMPIIKFWLMVVHLYTRNAMHIQIEENLHIIDCYPVLHFYMKHGTCPDGTSCLYNKTLSNLD